MNDDLISRKAVLELMHELLKISEYDGDKIIAVKDDIENLPTAFDTKKIAEHLNERKADNVRISKLQGNSHVKKISHICRSDEDDYCIRLVKGAVKE